MLLLIYCINQVIKGTRRSRSFRSQIFTEYFWEMALTEDILDFGRGSKFTGFFSNPISPQRHTIMVIKVQHSDHIEAQKPVHLGKAHACGCLQKCQNIVQDI